MKRRGTSVGITGVLGVLLGTCLAGATPPPAGPSSDSEVIPPPRRVPVVRRASDSEVIPPPRPPRLTRPVSQSPLPQPVAPVPSPLPDPPSGTETPPTSPTDMPLTSPLATPANVDSSLIPGRTVQPIDLVSALRLSGARDLDIAIARQRVRQSMADLERARSLWLPSIFLGPTWFRADGRIQTADGPVIDANRSALFLGGSFTSPNGFPAPSPGTGYPQLNSLSTVLRISDIIFEPLAARRIVAANDAGVRTATNDALLNAAEAYFDLQLASGQLAIAREAVANAEMLTEITASYAQTGEGLEADHRRALAELKRQRRNVYAASGRLLVASANLIRLLILDPRLVVAPVEPAESVIRLIPEDVPFDHLMEQALRGRPELAQSQEIVQATLLRWKQAKLRPFIPSVALTYSGGGFGGGKGEFFGDFGGRSEGMASLYWELQNLGFTDRAIKRRAEAEHRTAELEWTRAGTRVMADVASSYDTRAAASLQITEAAETVTEAVESLKLNMINMRQGAGLRRATRPIEVLQPIQALAQARLDYLDSVLAYNRAQFRLRRAIGQQP